MIIIGAKTIRMSLRGKAEASSKDEIPRYARNDIFGIKFYA